MKEIRALVKFAKKQNIKKLKVDGLDFEFAEPEIKIEDAVLDDKPTVEQGIKEAVAVQDLIKEEAEDPKAVTLDEEDLWSVS